MMKQILVVDDDQLMHRLFQHHLERAGYQMVSAMNGREAVEMAMRQPPHLIVMDIMMPETDGLAVLRELRKNDSTKSIPVIIITASSHVMMRKEAEVCGAAMFLNKPFSPTQLLNEIRRIVPPTE
ncbi:MAG TPA: response regulator [Verrucomicrobiae bacterium]|jgi:two-component system chemotaxis response regulator CheY|nr:response regulator [Verrucomicrobiae bacterium]